MTFAVVSATMNKHAAVTSFVVSSSESPELVDHVREAMVSHHVKNFSEDEKYRGSWRADHISTVSGLAIHRLLRWVEAKDWKLEKTVDHGKDSAVYLFRHD
jgi:hypothetical protein